MNEIQDVIGKGVPPLSFPEGDQPTDRGGRDRWILPGILLADNYASSESDPKPAATAGTGSRIGALGPLWIIASLAVTGAGTAVLGYCADKLANDGALTGNEKLGDGFCVGGGASLAAGGLASLVFAGLFTAATSPKPKNVKLIPGPAQTLAGAGLRVNF